MSGLIPIECIIIESILLKTVKNIFHSTIILSLQHMLNFVLLSGQRWRTEGEEKRDREESGRNDGEEGGGEVVALVED